MTISPGTMNCLYGTPSIWSIRPPSDRPKTTMNRLAETIGASTVCVHSFETRSVSRFTSQTRPLVPVELHAARLAAARRVRRQGRARRPGSRVGACAARRDATADDRRRVGRCGRRSAARALADVSVDHAAFAVAERRKDEIARLELLAADRAGKIGIAAGALDSDHQESPSDESCCHLPRSRRLSGPPPERPSAVSPVARIHLRFPSSARCETPQFRKLVDQAAIALT